MRRRILNCISTIDEFDAQVYEKLGIGVEIQDFTEPNLSAADIQDLVYRYKDLFKSYHQVKALHGPFLDLKPSSPDPLIRAISQERYRKALEIATELDMDYVIFHSQINPQLNEPYLSQLNNQQSRAAWLEILGQASAFQGTIVLENVFESTSEMLKDLIETIDLPNIKVNLDVGHRKLGTDSLEAWLCALKDHIAYIHLHSNNGIYDQHLKPSADEVVMLDALLEKHQLDPVIALEYRVKNVAEEMAELAGYGIGGPATLSGHLQRIVI